MQEQLAHMAGIDQCCIGTVEMKLPVIAGIIRRRILVNFRVDPDVMRTQLPDRFEPKLHNGAAIAGICLIRLEQIRPRRLPAFLGIASENAAHRIAVEWMDDDGQAQQGVFIPRRDTSSRINHLAGGRLFPGRHHLAAFDVIARGESIRFSMTSLDGQVAVRLHGEVSPTLPPGSGFGSLAEASAFFEAGSLGYSVTDDPQRLDGISLVTQSWTVEAMDVTEVHSSHFADETKSPKGSVQFDCALIMRDIAHEWHTAPDFLLDREAAGDCCSSA